MIPDIIQMTVEFSSVEIVAGLMDGDITSPSLSLGVQKVHIVKKQNHLGYRRKVW